MKAALEAWDLSDNAFQQGFAKQTDNPDIIAATMERPGIVLRRPVGSRAKFEVSPALAKSPPAQPRPKRQSAVKPKAQRKESGATVVSLERERARRERERAKQEKSAKRAQEKRRVSVQKATSELELATAQRDMALKKIELQRNKLDRLEQRERQKWEAKRRTLNAALDITKHS
jgi:hypothetical protein